MIQQYNFKRISSNEHLDTSISLTTSTTTSEITITTNINTNKSIVIYNLSSMIFYCISQYREKDNFNNNYYSNNSYSHNNNSNNNNNSHNNNNNNYDDNNNNISDNNNNNINNLHNLSNYFNDYENINKWDVINIENFLWNSIDDSQIDYSTIIVAIIYLNRILKSNQNEFYLTSGNWRNVISTCFLLASKMYDDLGMSNADFRNIFPTTELSRVNSFEIKICLLLEFALYVPDKEFLIYRRRYESNPTPSSSRRNSRRTMSHFGPSLSSLAYYESTKEETESLTPRVKENESTKSHSSPSSSNNVSPDLKKAVSMPCPDSNTGSYHHNNNNNNNNNNTINNNTHTTNTNINNNTSNNNENDNNNNTTNNNTNTITTRHSFIGSLHQGFRNYFGTNSSEVKNPKVKRRTTTADTKKVYCI